MAAILAVRPRSGCVKSSAENAQAGRCSRRGDSKWIDAEPQRGVLWCSNEDGLLHFRWKQIGEGAISNPDVDIDLIVFPDDATFEPVTQRERVYVLSFASSGDKHFFWMQDPTTLLDSWAADSINALIANPDSRPGPKPTAGPSSSASAPAPAATTSSGDVDMTDAPSGNNADFSSLIANLSRQMGQQQQPARSEDDTAAYTLPDVIPHSALTSFLTTLSPDRINALTEHLPAGVPHDVEHLRRTIESPEFRRAATGLDAALRTGALGPVTKSLGLPDQAALGVEAFLEAIQRQADAHMSSSSAMQTD